MHQPDDISENLRKLLEKGPSSLEALDELSRIASQDGLTEPELNMVLDISFDFSIRHSMRHTLISRCLIPDGQFLLHSSIVPRILGTVGVSEVYFRNGKQYKLKRLPPNSQNMLLTWLICVLLFFGRKLFEELQRLLAILFGLLEFEYLRPNIATLVIMALSQRQQSRNVLNGQARYPLKPWHLECVLRLSAKFPFDPYVKVLLAYMKQLNPTLDTKASASPRALSSSNQALNLYSDPSLNKLVNTHCSSDSSCGWEIREVREKIQRLFDSISSSKVKRRKIVIDSFNDLDLLASSSTSEAISIGTVESLRTLADKFDRITMANPGSLLTLGDMTNEKIRRYFVAFHAALGHNDLPVVKKFLQYIRFHCLSALAPQYSFDLLITFAELGLFDHVSVQLKQVISSNTVALERQLRLLSVLPPDIESLRALFGTLSKEFEEGVLASLVSELLKSILKWSSLHNEYGFFQDILITVCEVVQMVFEIFETKWHSLLLPTKVKFMVFLRSVRSIDFSEKEDVKALVLLVPKTTLAYQLILSMNPFILSEALGYIAFLRTLKFSEGSKALQLRNYYIMDSINLLWLDTAFRFEEDTFNRGLFLHLEFLKKLTGLNYFTYSDLLESKNIGDLSHNPALAYLTAELLWSIEDEERGITSRHLGPLSEDSVALLQHNPDVRWVRKTFFEIKVEILNRLDTLGYSGLCDLLFSSLRPLAGHRRKKGQAIYHYH